MNYRFYSFVANHYLSQLQCGLQTAHAVAEMSLQYPPSDKEGDHFADWARLGKTIIICGVNNHAGVLSVFDQINQFNENFTDVEPLQVALFREDEQSMNGMATACGVLVPEKYWGVDLEYDRVSKRLVCTDLTLTGNEMSVISYLKSFKLAQFTHKFLYDIINPYQIMEPKMKQAVCLLLKVAPTNGEYGGYVSVSHRNNSAQWGLPGGKVDAGETPLDAIVRETFEELGFELDRTLLKELFTQVCPGEVDYQTTTYTYPDITYEVADKFVPEDGLYIGVFRKESLCDTLVSPFAAYNQELFKAITVEDSMDRIEALLDDYVMNSENYNHSTACFTTTCQDMYDSRYVLLDYIRQQIEK